jgi:uncharacterized damage-inducible protein DinB
MAGLHATIAAGLTERYTTLAAKVRELAAPLSDEQFWRKPFPFGNSFGHLVLHLTGNLNYYIGAEIAGTGYVRDRDREFSETQRPSKEEVLKRFDQAIVVVLRAIREQSEEDWSKSYTAMREEDAGNRFNIFLRCATHLHHHLGQMIYLGYELNRQEKRLTGS